MSAVESINVELALPSGQSLGPASVPLSHTAALVVAEVAELLSLPLRTEAGKIEYELYWEQQGRVIPLNQTLAEAGVPEGDGLQVRAPVEVPLPKGGGIGPDPGVVGPDEPTIPVKVQFYIDNYSREPVEETLVYDDTVGSVIDQLATIYDLPRTTTYGGRVVYKLRSKALGSELDKGATLRQLEIKKYDLLTVQALANC